MTFEERAQVRERAADLEKKFGKGSVNASEFAEYLGLTYQTVCNKLRAHRLPGQKDGGSFLIPVYSIALWEARTSHTADEKEGF
jgi:hypothetical protein